MRFIITRWRQFYNRLKNKSIYEYILEVEDVAEKSKGCTSDKDSESYYDAIIRSTKFGRKIYLLQNSFLECFDKILRVLEKVRFDVLYLKWHHVEIFTFFLQYEILLLITQMDWFTLRVENSVELNYDSGYELTISWPFLNLE